MMQDLVVLGRRWLRRAFSLIEVMIALAVLVLLGALVLPSLHGMSDSVEFKETCDQLSSAVSVCRSEAQRRGTPMELVARKGTDGRVTLLGRPATIEDTSREQQTRTGQVLMVLPPGYSIDHDSGAAGASDAASDSAPAAEDSDVPEEAAAPAAPADQDTSGKSLVVFWASGGTSKGGGLFLHTRDGRVMGAEINSFTGMLRLSPIASDSSDESGKTATKKDKTGQDKTGQDGKAGSGSVQPAGPLSVNPDGP